MDFDHPLLVKVQHSADSISSDYSAIARHISPFYIVCLGGEFLLILDFTLVRSMVGISWVIEWIGSIKI